MNPNDIQIAQEILRIAMTTPAPVADVFVRYSAHTFCLEINAHKGGWHINKNVDFMSFLYVGEKTYINLYGVTMEAMLAQLRCWLADECGYQIPKEVSQ